MSVLLTSMRAIRWWALHCRSAIDKGLPFELRMLEGALEAVMQELGAEITELIDVAVPSLDALVTRVILSVLAGFQQHSMLTFQATASQTL